MKKGASWTYDTPSTYFNSYLTGCTTLADADVSISLQIRLR